MSFKQEQFSIKQALIDSAQSYLNCLIKALFLLHLVLLTKIAIHLDFLKLISFI